MRTITTNVYKIDEHPNPSKCYDWIRDNWHDLNQTAVDEMIQSIVALSNLIGGTYDFSISQVPDRSEHISFYDYDYKALKEIHDDYNLTGVWCDYDIIQALKKGSPSDALKQIHFTTEYVYSETGLYELCEANQYEFTEQGEFIS